ncbi:MAG: HD domain-containing protein [Prevotella sp.]|nr:HD domain-containing protein [Prevotella sp.]
MDYQSIIDKYYPSENELRRILLVHSRQVADRCLKIAKDHPELRLDKEFLEEAAMLHDIGIVKCDAPSIQCFGTEPYICHGVIGGRMLREAGYVRHAQVCERHTGTGLSRAQIERQQLPLPLDGCYEPETLEEQVICYADKFYSKTHPEQERTVVQTAQSLEKFGPEGVQKFLKWVDMFE